MTHKNLFEGSVCLGFNTFTDAYNQSGNRGSRTKWPEDVSLLRYSGEDIIALGIPVPRSQEFCLEKARQLRNAHPLSSILSPIPAVKTELLLPKYLESQDFVRNNSFVLGGDLPREVKISIHFSILIALMIFEMSKIKELLGEPKRIKSNRPHYYDVAEQKIIDVCKIFLFKE